MSNMKTSTPSFSPKKTIKMQNRSLSISKTSHGIRNHKAKMNLSYFDQKIRKDRSIKLFKVKFLKPKRNIKKTNFVHFRNRQNQSQEMIEQENEIYSRINPEDSGLIVCQEITFQKRGIRPIQNFEPRSPGKEIIFSKNQVAG